MTLYRPMRTDAEGLPVIAPKRWGLGVRIEGPKTDLTPHEGSVWALSGGMSVVDDWRKMHRDFWPVELGGTNRTETMFALAENALPAGLRVRQYGPEWHYLVEPGRKMPIDEYEALLAQTQGLWQKVGP